MSCCPDRPFVTDEICGNFNTIAPVTVPLTVWSTDGTVFPSGTVNIFYDRGTPATITATVTHSTGAPSTLTIPKGSSISETFSDITSVAIVPAGAIGKYCISVHYQL
ncbi:hypothetical protein D1872_205010 [compost metagenome]